MPNLAALSPLFPLILVSHVALAVSPFVPSPLLPFTLTAVGLIAFLMSTQPVLLVSRR